MAWTEQCKIEANRQIEHLKQTKGYSTREACMKLSPKSGIPVKTLQEWATYPEGRPERKVSEKSDTVKFNRTNDNVDWAKYTWNPVTGCKHGCAYCYARDIALRFPENFPKGFEPHFWEERLTTPQNTPLPKSDDIRARSVFVCSMADLFGDWVPQEWTESVLKTIEDAPQWTFLFLTKNPKRLLEFEWPDNAWVGTTVDRQDRVAEAEKVFAQLEATVKFASCEPLLEEVKFGNLKLFDWLIIGAQSKTSQVPEAQPKKGWVEALIISAIRATVPVYCKPNLRAGIREYPEQR